MQYLVQKPFEADQAYRPGMTADGDVLDAIKPRLTEQLVKQRYLIHADDPVSARKRGRKGSA